ncbi:hypothetical protein B0J13DRAFT_528783 [Dactylonectria estremocensis]|uniref:Uncharacterized protein n=1 Tax=Dactylonectria estremocensis TaxID=1079267 RepID=A0A9P9EDR9_9HYPO|nr:hypothetical protein B0J13DRAFT_528783 [Dactylonectria estremocensis]
MASSNPFRKSTAPTATTTAFAPTTTSPAAARFPSLETIDTSFGLTDPSVVDKKSKPVKKVRVLSPPPLSPDSPVWPFTAPLAASGPGQPGNNDPFDAASSDDSDREIVHAAAPPPQKIGSRVPANPFSKTLRDLENVRADHKLEKSKREEGNALKASHTARRSLDVNSFKRLLMTGNSGSGTPSTPPRTQHLIPSQKSAVDSSSVSLSSTYGGSKDGLAPGNEFQEVSLISRDTSDTPDDDLDPGSVSDSSASFHLSRDKKPPPPPSSRHGKSIRLQLGGEHGSPDALAPKSPSDINKPLPPAPHRKSFDDDAESPFDRESAGKAPENDAHPQTIPGGGRKTGPAPPPRRGHARGESKAYVTSLQKEAQDEEIPSRSSSIRSRTDRNRHDPHSPVPPPPPRRFHGSKPSTQISPAVAASIGAAMSQTSTSSDPQSESERPAAPAPAIPVEAVPSRDAQLGNYKISAPPPPPARNTSVRRPASVRSMDNNGRRTSAEAKPHSGIAPPPPPRRQRGSSRSSVDAPYRRTSIDEVPRTEERRPEEGNSSGPDIVANPDYAPPQSADVPGKGVNILADLDALRREVDALRGKLG